MRAENAVDIRPVPDMLVVCNENGTLMSDQIVFGRIAGQSAANCKESGRATKAPGRFPQKGNARALLGFIGAAYP